MRSAVIDIQPGLQDDALHCNLVIIRRDSNDPYKALSYTWGDATSTNCIYVNDRAFWIHGNLYEVLYRVRDEAHVVRLWIDRICINQLDVPERNAQVQRMGMTYARAQEVLIWLGPAPADSHSLADLFHAAKEQSTFTAADWREKLPSVQRVFCLPWFQRLWVYHEAVLAQKGTVILGHETCDLNTLLSFDSLNMLDLSDIYGQVEGATAMVSSLRNVM